MNNLKKSVPIGLLALTLTIPNFATAKPAAPKNRITIEQARATAKGVFAGEIKSEELEFEGGKWIYSFDLSKSGQTGVQEVQVDAISGRVISSKHESPKDEANEAKKEHD